MSGIRMNQRGTELGHCMNQLMFGLMRDAVRVGEIHCRINVEFGIGM